MDYFFVNPKQVQGLLALVRDEEFKHLARVVRKKEGEKIVLLDGEDNAYEALIRSMRKDHAECEIIRHMPRLNEPAIEVTLAVSILRNPARFDVLVEKATELGVRRIAPMISERTIPRRGKHARLQKIALSAMKQCGRAYLPRILPLSSFEDIISADEHYSLRLLPHEGAGLPSLQEVLMKHRADTVLIAVGPEGGFTDEEVAGAVERKFLPVSLGPRRLRTETAALAALSGVIGST
jgi:16S rRNA (uracil1498-N3)-methyltransferase